MPGIAPDTTATSPDESGRSDLNEAQVQRGFVLLAMTTFAMAIAMNITQAIQPNFFRDVIGMDGAQNGYLIAIREVSRIPAHFRRRVSLASGNGPGGHGLADRRRYWLRPLRRCEFLSRADPADADLECRLSLLDAVATSARAFAGKERRRGFDARSIEQYRLRGNDARAGRGAGDIALDRASCTAR